MNEKSKKNLLIMDKMLQHHKRTGVATPHDKIQTGRYPYSDLYYAKADVPGMGPVKVIEQNPKTKSVYAEAAQQGIPISWVILDGPNPVYSGYVVVQLPNKTKPEVMDAGELKKQLNPLCALLESET